MTRDRDRFGAYTWDLSRLEAQSTRGRPHQMPALSAPRGQYLASALLLAPDALRLRRLLYAGLYYPTQDIDVFFGEGNHFPFFAVHLDVVHIRHGPRSAALPQTRSLNTEMVGLIWTRLERY